MQNLELAKLRHVFGEIVKQLKSKNTDIIDEIKRAINKLKKEKHNKLKAYLKENDIIKVVYEDYDSHKNKFVRAIAYEKDEYELLAWGDVRRFRITTVGELLDKFLDKKFIEVEEYIKCAEQWGKPMNKFRAYCLEKKIKRLEKNLKVQAYIKYATIYTLSLDFEKYLDKIEEDYLKKLIKLCNKKLQSYDKLNSKNL